MLPLTALWLAHASTPGIVPAKPVFTQSVADLPRASAGLLRERTELDGERALAQVHAEVERHLPQFASCAGADPRPDSRTGTVSLAFAVDAAGVPRHLAVDGGSLLSTDIRSCVVANAQALDFGSGAEAGVRVVLALDA